MVLDNAPRGAVWIKGASAHFAKHVLSAAGAIFERAFGALFELRRQHLDKLTSAAFKIARRVMMFALVVGMPPDRQHQCVDADVVGSLSHEHQRAAIRRPAADAR